MLLIFLGAIFILYDIVLLSIHPGTLLSTLFSFTHIWTAFGALLIFTAVNRKKRGRFFWCACKKQTKATALALLIFCVALSAINLGFILTPRLASAESEADYVILLGGGIDKNGELSETVLKRVNKAAAYLLHHKNALCVATGGKAMWSNYTEAPELKRQLIRLGVAEQQIVIEDRALDTIQNLQYSAAVLSDCTGKSQKEILDSRVIIVSNFFHLRRAERLASRIGFTNVSGLGTEVEPYTVPHNYLREISAYIKLNLRILLTGKPQKLA